MRALKEILADVERRKIELRLNPAHGRLEFAPFDALDEEPDLFDELRKQRRALEQDLWAGHRPPKKQSPVVREPEMAIDEPYEPW